MSAKFDVQNFNFGGGYVFRTSLPLSTVVDVIDIFSTVVDVIGIFSPFVDVIVDVDVIDILNTVVDVIDIFSPDVDVIIFLALSLGLLII